MEISTASPSGSNQAGSENNVIETEINNTKQDTIQQPGKMLDFDDMLVHVGEFGHYQRFLFGFQAPFCMFLAFNAFGQLFMQLYPDIFWCEDEFECNIGIISDVQKQMLSTPFEASEYTCELNEFKHDYLEEIAANEEKAWDGVCKGMESCTFNGTHWYSENGVYVHDGSLRPSGSPGSSSAGSGRILPGRCYAKNMTTTVSLKPSTDFVFSHTFFEAKDKGKTLDDCKNVGWQKITPGNAANFYPNIVTEGHWWCIADMLIAISQSIFFVGAIIGGILIGWIADKFGRVPALVTANFLGAVGGILSTLTTNFYLFSFFRFITGMAYDNCFIMIYILVLEFCGPYYRTIVANLSIAVFFTLGSAILPWIAEYVDNWRTFGLIISIPMLLAIAAIFVVPESSRWLLSIGKAKRATDILRRFAKVNRKKVDEQIFVDFEEGAQKLYEEASKKGPDPSLKEAFKTPRFRRTFILLVLISSGITLVYEGHNRNILNLANEEWNLFWMFSLAALTELPADILVILTLDFFGRRWMCCVTLILSGISSCVAAAVPEDAWTTTFINALLSRFFVNMSFNICLQYAPELLPTGIRAQGVNAIHIIGYVAALFSPLIGQLGHHHSHLSLLLLGLVAFFAGVLSLFLPETLGEDLPNDLVEAENFGKNQSFWNCPCFAKPKPADKERKATNGNNGAPMPVPVVEVEAELAEYQNILRAPSRADIRRFCSPAGDDRSIMAWLFS